jgi:hypothetical protein
MPEQTNNEGYWTQQRVELRGWFQRNAPSLGELYEGGLRLIFDVSFPGRVRLISHAVREIRNRLPDVIAGEKGGRVEYVNRLDEIASRWKRAGLSGKDVSGTPIVGGGPTSLGGILISRDLFLRISALVEDHIESRERPVDKAFRFFETIASENQALRDSLRPIILQWMEVTGWFMRQAHDSGAPDMAVDGKELLKRFNLFETMLAALIRGFFHAIEGLDEILEDANA